MSNKTMMNTDELNKVFRQVRPGSRLKVEFVDGGFRDDMRRRAALISLIGACVPTGNVVLVEKDRRADLERASKDGFFAGSRTYFLRIRDGFDQYGPLHDAAHSGLINRMRKV